MGVTVKIKPLPHGEGLPLPTYHSELAAGADLVAAVEETSPITLPVGGRALVPCGFSMALPEGYEAQVRPRSGLALKAGISLLNTPGTIDADYRGEVKVLLVNFGNQPFEVTRGLRIAQIVIAPVLQAVFEVTEVLPESMRGEGGFGSTGHA